MSSASSNSGFQLAPALAALMRDGMPLRLVAFDGSSAGPEDGAVTLELTSERGLAYLLGAPGDLGLARAYVTGELVVHGVHPGDPYEALSLLMNHTKFRAPTPSEVVGLLQGIRSTIGLKSLAPPPVPPQEHLPRWRRVVEGVRHSLIRDAEAIHHHYDVSNTFYEHVLGPSMAYTCAVYPELDSTLEAAQEEKFDLVCRKLGLQPGQRLLDIGCGWGGMVRHAAKHYGVTALGVTLSREQASWAKAAIDADGLGDVAEVRHSDYRDVLESDFDAISSIGLLEHIGVKQYPEYFGFVTDHLRPGGKLLNHQITRPHNKPTSTGAFIDRYVFPDGELTGSGTIIAAAQDAGLEVVHEENFRKHYAMTLRDWNRNLRDSWEECVAEVGEGTARVWGLYMAGSRLAFERNEIQLHQVLASKPTAEGDDGFGLRLQW
ncbi:class I SAM-dependent methyltransferase [Nocardioides bruguierae]|nr:class I SAM-dependent methyltransferase [Nocardioides bruguierae]